jgi:hypothetical protein
MGADPSSQKLASKFYIYYNFQRADAAARLITERTDGDLTNLRTEWLSNHPLDRPLAVLRDLADVQILKDCELLGLQPLPDALDGDRLVLSPRDDLCRVLPRDIEQES